MTASNKNGKKEPTPFSVFGKKEPTPFSVFSVLVFHISRLVNYLCVTFVSFEFNL